MFRQLIAASSIAASLALAPLTSNAEQSPGNQPQMKALQYLVGTWHCSWQSGNQAGSEDQVFTSVLNGAWLEEREIVNVNGRPMVNTIHYTGYNPRTKSYVHVGPDADGSFEVAQSPDGDTWASTDGTLVHHRISDTERRMSETAAGSQAVQVTMTCMKSKE